MTEVDWVTCADPDPMLRFIRDRASERQLRLIGLAYCRRFWHAFLLGRSRRVVEVAERYADRLATEDDLRAACSEAEQWGDLITSQDFEGVALARLAVDAARVTLNSRPLGTPALVRDVFGNPFRPAPFDAAWRTADVVAVAAAAYEERPLPSGELDTRRLAVLADALEEVAADEAVVSHLRSDGPHVRGCWVVDRCLGRM